MTQNRVDILLKDEGELGVASGAVHVTIDGVYCPEVQAVRIERAAWPDFSKAVLRYTTADDADAVQRLLQSGKRVRLDWVYDGAIATKVIRSVVIFAGEIETVRWSMSEKGQVYEILVYDPSAKLGRINVHGRRFADAQSSVYLLSDSVIFNEQGKANASVEKVSQQCREYRLFAPAGHPAVMWQAGDILAYLIGEYLPAGSLGEVDEDRLNALVGDIEVRDLDVTGLSLFDALVHCCERVGLKFYFTPRMSPDKDGACIVFYRETTGRVHELACQSGTEQLSLAKTDIAAVRSTRLFSPVTYETIVQGSFKTYEATFELKKGWDSSLEYPSYDMYSSLTNPNFYQVKDVHRKWVLNESGEYAPYGAGDAYDFSYLLGDAYVPQRRRFYPCLTTDELGRSMGYFLEVSFDDGATWQQYLRAFDNLLDECAVYLSSEQLDFSMWIAALKGTLRVRMTASIRSDERIRAAVADGPTGGTAAVVREVFTNPRQWRFAKRTQYSRFASAAGDGLGEPDEADDREAMMSTAVRLSRSRQSPTEQVRVKMLLPRWDVFVGDEVKSALHGRDILGTRNEERSKAVVRKVCVDFEKQQSELEIVRWREML